MSLTAPNELVQRPQWVAWERVAREGDPKPTKVPINARTTRHASSTDPRTWTTFEEACAFPDRHPDWQCSNPECVGHSEGIGGIGYVLSADDPYTGVDLDGCRDPQTGRIETWAKQIVHRLNSYTEISPSGTGLRIFVRGELPPHGRHKGHIEVYSRARFLTITGDRYLAAPDSIEERAEQLLEWHHEVFGDPPESRQNGHVQRSPVQLADADLLIKAHNAKNGGAFRALWNGDYSAYPSQNEADLALVGMLLFWCGPDPARIDQLFRSSGLYREKWDRQDYRERTIDKALEGKTEFYSGSLNSSPQLIVPEHIDPVTGEVIYERRFRFLTADELKHRPDPEFIIDHVLQKNTLALIVGAQESYKSFLGLDMAMAVSDGGTWQGRPVEQGTVAYISAEGGSGLKLRVEAWETDHDQMVEHCYFLADQAPQFLDRGRGGDVEELLLSLNDLPSRPVLIFIDTLARTMVGGDENSAQDMGLFIASAEQIRQATGATVVMIHHNNKEGMARGSTALLGAVHTIIECSRERNSSTVVVKCGKQKDTDHFDTMMFTSQVVELEGEERASLVLHARDLGNIFSSGISKQLSNQARVALDTLSGMTAPAYAEWRDAMDMPNTTFRRVRSELVNGGYVDHKEDRYYLSDVGRMFGATKGQSGAVAPAGPKGQKGPLREGPLALAGDDGPEPPRAKPDSDVLPWG